MSDQEPLFEIISGETFRKENVPRTSKTVATEPRTLTTWIAIPTSMGFCTVPAHEEVQKLLNPDQLEYRQMYPTRMVWEINGLMVCRDCFYAEADKE